MRYIWIWMLLVIEMIWLATSIMDVKHTIKYVKESSQYDSTADFVDCVMENLEGYTKAFIALHIAALFIISFVTWLNFKIDSAK